MTVVETMREIDVLTRINFEDDTYRFAPVRAFGRRIEEVVRETLGKLDVTSGQFLIEDKGALDCVVAARVQTAVMRAVDGWSDNWSALS